MSDPERFPIDFPGFLRTAEGGYAEHEDFLSFVAGASTAKNGTPQERGMAWIRKQGVTKPLEQLTSDEVSRLSEAAKKVITARLGRERRASPRPEEPMPPPEDETEPTDEM